MPIRHLFLNVFLFFSIAPTAYADALLDNFKARIEAALAVGDKDV